MKVVHRTKSQRWVKSGIRVQEVLQASLMALRQRSIRGAPSDLAPALDPATGQRQIQAEGEGAGIRAQEVLEVSLTALRQRSIRGAPSDPAPVLDSTTDLRQIQAEE